jgi:hypothetical protein
VAHHTPTGGLKMRIFSMTARPGRGHRSRLVGCVVLSICVLSLLAAQLAAAQGSSQYTQSAVAMPPPTDVSQDDWTLHDTACSTTTSCVAVGAYNTSQHVTLPYVSPITSGQPGAAVAVTLPANAQTSTQTSALQGVSCQSGNACTAYGDYTDSSGDTQDMVVQIADGVPSRAVEVTAPSNATANTIELKAISCPTSGGCVAVGYYENSGEHNDLPLVVPINGGVPGTAVTASMPANQFPLSAEGYFKDVACQSASSCTAVGVYEPASQGNEAMVVQITNGSPATGVEVLPADNNTSNPNASLSRVACPASGSCEAVGYYTNGSGVGQNMQVPITAGTPGAVTGDVTGPTGADPPYPYMTFTGMSCSSASLCVASGTYEPSSGGEAPAVLTITGSGVAASAVSLPSDQDSSVDTAGVDTTHAVSCQASGPCFTSGYYPLGADSAGGLLAEISAAGQVGAGQQAPTPGDTAANSPIGPGQYDYLEYGIGCDASGSCVTSGEYYNNADAWLPYLVILQSPLSVSTSSLPGATESAAYSTTLAAAGAWGLYSWSIASGSLPAGLSLNTQTGVISGTPTGSGSSSFTVQVTGTGSPTPTATQSLSLTVAAVAPQLRLLSASGKLNANKLGVKLSCAEAPCSGTVKLEITKVVIVKHGKKRVRKHKTVVLGSAHYAVAAGVTGTLKVTLNGAGKSALRKAKKHRLTVTVLATLVGGKSVSRRETIYTVVKHKKR